MDFLIRVYAGLKRDAVENCPVTSVLKQQAMKKIQKSQLDARGRSPDHKCHAKMLKFFPDFQTRSDLKLFVTQHKYFPEAR
jgi:hypothetical protein